MGIVLQESVLFAGRFAITSSLGNQMTDDEVIAAAQQAHIHDFIMTLEDGYQTKVSEEDNVFSTVKNN